MFSMDIIRLEKKVLQKNDEIAQMNRLVFREKGIIVHNLIGSPGTGKTRILERIIEKFENKRKIGVIEGDCQTDRDAQRISKYNIPVVQVITDGGCHLIAAQIQQALEKLPLSEIDLLFIENVGNLVCPTNFDLGEFRKWVVISTAEGDDKPLKYPGIFSAAEIMVVNKVDLIPYVDCDIDALRNNALSVNPKLTIFSVSGKTGEGIDTLCDGLFSE